MLRMASFKENYNGSISSNVLLPEISLVIKNLEENKPFENSQISCSEIPFVNFPKRLSKK